jgi:signal transduction histidine kinase
MAGYLFAAACAVLLCACYSAGRAALPPLCTAAIAAAALCVPATQFAIRPAGLASVTGSLSAYLVFAVLPLVAGRYVAAQRKAVERERLRERWEIARQMHDSLGRRLSLASVQAAALEVSDLPASQHAAIARLAAAVRASATELHEILSLLRAERSSPRMSAVGGLVEEFRATGAVVSVRSRGAAQPLPPQADEAAYRVIEEGLTNAIRHAPGRPISVSITWEAGMLLLTVVNQTDYREYAPGSGLADLAGRLHQVSGTLDHETVGGQFRLHAALPAAPAAERAKQPRVTALELTAGILLLVILPAAVLLGVR